MVELAEDRDVKDEGEIKTTGGVLTTRNIIIFAVLLSVVLTGVIVGTTLYFTGDDDAATQSEANENVADDEEIEVAREPRHIDPGAKPLYFAMEPRFIVSFSDQSKARYMQFSLQVMTRDDEVIELLKQHMPAVRSSLLLMTGSQNSEKVSTREGKEKLLEDITEDINATLDNVAGMSGVESTYFDYFVVQ